jgi:hypothetical protein
MTEPVTYTLTPSGANSEEYYRTVRGFADEVVERASRSLLRTVDRFTEYLLTFALETPRRTEEYLLELLSFGILWNTYGGYALAVRRAPFITMARMAEWRKKHQAVKPAIDLLRGILVTLFLLPRRGATKPHVLPGLREADRLSLWLEATGEFREQAIRFVRWRAFWETMSAEERAAMGAALFAFADWFTVRAGEVLGKYTLHVEPFVQRAKRAYRWREDRVQCSRSRAEYHLNMVGAEIMNRAFREEFLAADERAVLVPGCMRGRPEEDCLAVKEAEGLKCAGCLTECRVNQLREMGLKRGFAVYIIPHASDLSLWSPSEGRPVRGVIASACVTTLVEGGWELKRYDVPAQCVLLDYSGCRKHWHPEGVPTALNLRELKRILSSPAPRPEPPTGVPSRAPSQPTPHA